MSKLFDYKQRPTNPKWREGWDRIKWSIQGLHRGERDKGTPTSAAGVEKKAAGE